MTPSKILFYLCLSFTAGILINSLIKLPQIFVWGFLISAVVAMVFSFFIKQDNFFIIGFCILFLAMGSLRFQISEFEIANNELRKLNDSSEKIVLSGKIVSEPDVRDTFQKLKIEIENPTGTLLVTTDKYPEFEYLDKIKLNGKLETPSETEDFSYKNYLMKDGIYSVMFYPKIEKIGKADKDIFNKFYSGVLFLKQKLRESIRFNFSPPERLILEGTVLGDNGAMSQELKDKLNATGLRHVIAVSGTHVVILSVIIMSLLLALGLWRGQAFYLSVVFIWFYILLTGLSASGVRAGIMGSLFLLAQKLGRQSMGSRIIAIACALMLFINPLLLFSDVGFQLSFLAVLGLIYCDPIIKNMIKVFIKIFIPAGKDKAENFISIVSTTFAAQIFTLPIMIYNFGNVSLVSPITNLLILPIVYPLMVFGFLSSFVGMFFNNLGWVLSIPCYFLLRYFLWVIDIFSQPWAMVIFKNASLIWLVASYLIISLIVSYLNKKQKQKMLG